jgi:prepilin-type N-terminal cleavage/methylation domain-containing protein
MPANPLSRLTARAPGRHAGPLPADSGFALTEVLVAGMIFAIISAGAVAAVNAGIHSASATHERVVTANVAQQAIQQAVTMPRASLTATPSPAASTITVGNGKYLVTRSIGYFPAGANACPSSVVVGTPYAIVVHVSAVPVASNTRSVQMDTVIAC